MSNLEGRYTGTEAEGREAKVITIVPEDRTSSHRGLFSGFEIHKVCSSGFWTCLGLVTFLFL